MSKAIKRLGTRIIPATAIGKRYNQHKSINWSYLKRGRVALTNTNKKHGKQVLIPKKIDCKLNTESFTKTSDRLYPPKNSIDVIQLNNTIDEYSPRKKNTKGTELCSVINPETNSDSKFLKIKVKEIDKLIYIIFLI